MLDRYVRPLIDPPLNATARVFVKAKVPANAVTWAGFVIGITAIPALAYHKYDVALALLALHSIADGLDGAIARQTRMTDYGGFLDIVLDFIFYAGFVFGMAMAKPEEAIYAAFLIFTFMSTASTFLAYAILAEKHHQTTDIRGSKSLYYIGGLAEGSETLIVFALFCLKPEWFVPLAILFGIMCLITATGRLLAARAAFGPGNKD